MARSSSTLRALAMFAATAVLFQASPGFVGVAPRGALQSTLALQATATAETMGKAARSAEEAVPTSPRWAPGWLTLGRALLVMGAGVSGVAVVGLRPGVGRPEARISCRALQTGLVGLPNVGKSTMFNALTQSGKAEMRNMPFSTIEPNIAKAPVPDARVDRLAALSKSGRVVHEMVEYVDIAGLIKNAHKGEGLGNQFLSTIRNVDAIVHMVRCFEAPEIVHVDISLDPLRDAETITLELVLADYDQCEKRMKKNEKDVRGKVPGADKEQSALAKVLALFEVGKPARMAVLTEDERAAVKHLGFITMKPMIYAANVAEDELAEGNAMVEKLRTMAAESGDQVVIVSAAVENELVGLGAEERAEYLESLGVTETGVQRLTRATYEMLHLRTYFTCGPEETRAWTIREGWKAPKAASVIHTDFEKGFIKAATVDYETFVKFGSEEEAKKAGKLRYEGKEYVVQEGDVMHFLFK